MTRYGSLHQRLRRQVLVRDSWRCHWCGGRASQADHVVALADGGAETLANLVAACATCNQRRGGAVGLRRSRAVVAPLPGEGAGEAVFSPGAVAARPLGRLPGTHRAGNDPARSARPRAWPGAIRPDGR